MNIIKPKLKENYDTVGIFAVSAPDAVSFPVRYSRAKENLKYIFNNIVASNVTEGKSGFVTANEEDRANDFINFMNNKAIDVLISLTGGYNTNSILSKLPYEEFRKQCKPIIGFSDTTTLLLALYKQAGMITFYGPSVMSNFGEYPRPNEYTIKVLQDILNLREDSYEYKQPKCCSKSFLFWDKEDKKESEYVENSGWHTIGVDEAKGILIGGNLNSMLALAGTEYWPNLEGAILFLEEAFTTPNRFYRDMVTLEQMGVWNKINGLIFGEFFCPGISEKEYKELEDIVKKFANKYNIPTIYKVNFGHSSPMMTIPIGIKAEIDVNKCTFRLLESVIQ
jgi:muramoyltetrapeptide carboxypeptidase